MLELLLPSRCISCGAVSCGAVSCGAVSRGHAFSVADGSAEPRLLCEACRGLLIPLATPLCARCGAPTVWPVERCRECVGRRLAFSSARAAVNYAGPARALVRAWKERGVHPLAVLAADLVAARVPRPAAADVITYIPPDGDRSLRRGHQPAEGLARELARRWELEHANLLARRRRVRRQTGLPLEERRRNVRGAFAARGPVRGTVVLVDDVYTTGATVAAAASALRAGGAQAVHVVTLARVVR